MLPYKIGTLYRLNTLAPAVLGSVFNNIRVIGIIDYSVACQYINVKLMHATIYPLLPAGTPDDPQKYIYLLFMTEAGTKTVLAMPWIDESSVQEITSVSIVITVHQANMEDVSRIRQTLDMIGYKNITIAVQ